MGNIKEVRFLTDDRDFKRRNELVIQIGGNGDWYIATVPEGEKTVGRGVRICTSGGASTSVPGLTIAVADMFRSLERAAPDSATGSPGKPEYFVIINREGKIEVTPWEDRSMAETDYERKSWQWTGYLCKVIRGPKI
jgi:hypothetical protein